MFKKIWQWFGFGKKKVSDTISIDVEVSTQKALRQIEGVREAADKLQVSLAKLRAADAQSVDFNAAIRHPNYNVDGTQRNIICSDGRRVPIPPRPPKQQRVNSSGSSYATGGTIDTTGDFLMGAATAHAVGSLLQSEDTPTRSSSSSYDSGLSSSSAYSSSFSGGSSDSYSGSSDSGGSSDW